MRIIAVCLIALLAIAGCDMSGMLGIDRLYESAMDRSLPLVSGDSMLYFGFRAESAEAAGSSLHVHGDKDEVFIISSGMITNAMGDRIAVEAGEGRIQLMLAGCAPLVFSAS